MVSESGQRRTVTSLLKPLNAIAVENPVLPGTPDVNYVEGWIELKWLRAWPKRETTIVNIDHFTVQQRVWHFKRRRAGGQAWFLLQCRREWLLLDGAIAAIHVNNATKAELIELSDHYWRAGLVQSDLVELLSAQKPPFNFTPQDLARMREHHK